MKMAPTGGAAALSAELPYAPQDLPKPEGERQEASCSQRCLGAWAGRDEEGEAWEEAKGAAKGETGI